MSLTSHGLHRGALFHIHCVCCRPHDTACGAVEHTSVNQLALPLRGVFVKHHEAGAKVVAAAGQALFFNAGEEYRVSHPAGGDDDCLVLEPSPAALQELLERFDPEAVQAGRQSFRATHATLPPAAALERALLWQSLRAGTDVLEIETRALELLAAALAQTPPQGQRRPGLRPQALRRRREQVQATALTLAAQPEQPWSLQRLAQRVHASPFHLARSFHREMGEPVHRYLLRVRLARGLDAALDGVEPLTSIAVRLGFSTPSHFTEAFRRLYGLAPSALRRRLAAAAAGAQSSKISTAGDDGRH
jgi:AraC-like DNA-binding protein